MKLLLFAAAAASATAFAFTGTSLDRPCRPSTALNKGYVPDGLSEDEYRMQQYKDSHPRHPKHFKSRSLVDFQRDLDSGKVRHQFPVMFAKVGLHFATLSIPNFALIAHEYSTLLC